MPTVQPLSDRIVLKRHVVSDKTSGGIIIPELAKKPGLECEVVAVGPGRPLVSGQRMAPYPKVGDKVLIGEWVGVEVKVGGVPHLFVREDEILAILVPDPPTPSQA